MGKTKTILVATREIHGGTEKGGRAKLKAQEEMTPEAQKELGLKKDDLDALVASGSLIEVPARISGRGEDAAEIDAANARADKAEKDLKTATERADKAEQDLAAANESIATLTTQLEEAKKAAAPKAAS